MSIPAPMPRIEYPLTLQSCQAYYMRDEDTWTKIDYTAKAETWMTPLQRGKETGLGEQISFLARHRILTTITHLQSKFLRIGTFFADRLCTVLMHGLPVAQVS